MSSSLTRLLKRWRDNCFVSALLAGFAKPLYIVSHHLARRLQQSIRKNGATILLPNGRQFTIARDAGIGSASLLFWHGLDGHEPATSRVLRFMFERSSTFIDVGANCGFYSVLAALWNPGLQIVAFEPVPEIFAELKRNVHSNGVADLVHCENLALSSRSGHAPLFLPVHEGLEPESTGTLVRDGWQATKGAPCIEVKASRFDEYEAVHPMRVDLIKIDVEDFEADVLEGMRSVIERDRPFIVCEVLPRAHRNERTLAIVTTLKYQPYWITPVGYVRVTRFDFNRENWTDFLLSPVSTPDTVITDLGVLLDLKERDEVAMRRA